MTALQRDSGSRRPLCQQKLAWKYCISPRGRGFQTIPRRILFSPPPLFLPHGCQLSRPHPTRGAAASSALPLPTRGRGTHRAPITAQPLVGVSRAPLPAVLPERCKQTAPSWRAARRPSLAWDGAPLKRQKDGMHQPEAGCESCTATASIGGEMLEALLAPFPCSRGPPSPPGPGFLSPTPFPSMRNQARSCVYRANNGAPASIYSWVLYGAAAPPPAFPPPGGITATSAPWPSGSDPSPRGPCMRGKQTDGDITP